MAQSLKLVVDAGQMSSHSKPVFAFCFVEDSGLFSWFAIESPRLINPPALYEAHADEFSRV